MTENEFIEQAKILLEKCNHVLANDISNIKNNNISISRNRLRREISVLLAVKIQYIDDRDISSLLSK